MALLYRTSWGCFCIVIKIGLTFGMVSDHLHLTITDTMLFHFQFSDFHLGVFIVSGLKTNYGVKICDQMKSDDCVCIRFFKKQLTFYDLCSDCKEKYTCLVL